MPRRFVPKSDAHPRVGLVVTPEGRFVVRALADEERPVAPRAVVRAVPASGESEAAAIRAAAQRLAARLRASARGRVTVYAEA